MHVHERPISLPPAPVLAHSERPLLLLGSLALGVVAARVVTTALRRHRLRWTWALLVPPLELPARPLLGGLFPIVTAAAVTAAALGRSRHREDLAWGGDLREQAEARTGPLLLARTALVALFDRYGADPARRALGRERVVVGRDRRSGLVSVPFGARGGRHTLVLGATGAGKTVTQTWILTRTIEAGFAAVAIDPKGDPRMHAQLAESAIAAGRELLLWTPFGPSAYNPFGHGSAAEIADRALAGERFTEPHYQRQAQRYLGYAVRALRGAGIGVSLPEIVRRLDPQALQELAELLGQPQAEATLHYLDTLSARQRADLSGVRDRLAILAESDMAGWLAPARAGAPAFDLLDAIRRRAVVYFALQSDSWPLLAQMIGAAIVGDLRATMSALQRSPVPTVVAIDEFAAVAAEQVAHLFGRARSAGINLLLAAQDLSDLRVEGRPQLREQVLGNLSSVIAHRQVVCESAELISRLAGSRGAWRATQTRNGWTRSRTSTAVIAAEPIRTLAVGEAAVLDLAAGSACVARIFSGRAR